MSDNNSARPRRAEKQKAIDAAWERELDRREAEIESGRENLLTHEEVMISLRAALAETPKKT